jgi:hypothetical protein
MMKVKAIQRRRWPLTYKGLRSLLGLANYYHHFIQDFSKVARTLLDLLEKKWLSLELDELCHQAVGKLKSKVSSPPVLKFVEFDKPFEVYTGASILHWRSVDASWMAISYESMKLNGCQRKRPTHRYSTSLGDVATLVGVAQYQGVHEPCVLKLLWDTCAREHQTIAVAQYIGAYEGGFDPQSGPLQYGTKHAKRMKRVPNNEHHPSSCS